MIFGLALLAAFAGGFAASLAITAFSLKGSDLLQQTPPPVIAKPDTAIVSLTPTPPLETSSPEAPPVEASPSAHPAGAEETDSPLEEKTALPLEGLIIGVDAGHQTRANLDTEPNAPGSGTMKMKVSGGTQGRWTGTPEYQVNLDVALLLRDLLEEQGATVIMTREINDVNISNAERAQIFNAAMTDYALRIHCNGSEDTNAHGAFMLVPQTNPFKADCDLAAQFLIDAFCESTGAKNSGLLFWSDQTGFNWSERMIILIEMGHMTNEAEDYKLSDKEYQYKMAQGLLNGILRYFEAKSNAE